MDAILVVNPGSSSKKYALYFGDRAVFTAKYELTAAGFAVCTEVNKERQLCEGIASEQFSSALTDVLARAIASGVIRDELEITRVGVRVVAPGTRFTRHELITPEFLAALTGAAPRAPLHTPLMLAEIAAVQQAVPRAQCYAVSDSAFHTTIPAWRTCYSLKGTLEADVRRFGYHGLSVASVARRLDLVFGDVPHDRIVVLHVGNGVSATALRAGESVATTMGFTPGSGLLMGSRAGDLDPGALIYMLELMGKSGAAAHELIQTTGGFKGMTGVSDIRSVLEREAQRDPAAVTALRLFVEGLQEAILKFTVPLGGLDAVVVTGTALERNGALRGRILEALPFNLVTLDRMFEDDPLSVSRVISTKDSTVAAAVIPTDEMGEVARVVNSLN